MGLELIARLGDTSTHGGEIVTSASKTFAEKKKIAREGDILNCPVHGPNPIVGHSAKHKAEGKYLARQTDLTECGAALISGATKTKSV